MEAFSIKMRNTLSFIRIVLCLFISLALVPGVHGVRCYNWYYYEHLECTWGCCGNAYSTNYHCCSVGAGIIVSSVFGIIFVLAVIFVIASYFYKRQQKAKQVVRPAPQVTMVTTPAIQQQQQHHVIPGYTGPNQPVGGPGVPPPMYPPPAYQAIYNDPAYPPPAQPAQQAPGQPAQQPPNQQPAQ